MGSGVQHLRRLSLSGPDPVLTEGEWPLKTCTLDSAYFTLLPVLVLGQGQPWELTSFSVCYIVHTDSWDNGNAGVSSFLLRSIDKLFSLESALL